MAKRAIDCKLCRRSTTSWKVVLVERAKRDDKGAIVRGANGRPETYQVRHKLCGRCEHEVGELRARAMITGEDLEAVEKPEADDAAPPLPDGQLIEIVPEGSIASA